MKFNFFKNIIFQNRQFVLFIITGGAAAFVNIISRILLSLIFAFEIAVLLAYGIGMIIAYILNRRFVFSRTQQSIRRSFAAFSLVNLLAVLQTLILSSLIRDFLLQSIDSIATIDLIAHITGVLLPILTSFFGHKYLSFREPWP